MEIRERIKNKIWLIAALIVFCGVFFLFGHYKAYLYEDEVLSYTAANSEEGMRPSVPVNSCVSGREFVLRAVAVQNNERFDFRNAVKNTSKDPHPPLYPVLLHFISSLFPGIFSKWFALVINLLSGTAVIVLLYTAAYLSYPRGDGKNEDKKEKICFAGAVTLIYILSLGAVEQFMNLRMYVLLQVFTTALTLQYLLLFERLEKKEKLIDKRQALLFILNILFGTLTHYYFLIFAFYEAAFISILLLWKKLFREFFIHASLYLVSGLLVIIIFPKIIWQLTATDVGSESRIIRTLPELIRRGRVMFFNLNEALFGGEAKLIILILLVFAVLVFIKSSGSSGERAAAVISSVRQYTEEKHAFFIFTGLFYFLTVSLTTPYLTARYLSGAYHIYILITVWLLLPLLRRLFRSEKAGLLILVLIMAVPLYLKVKAGLFDVNKAAMGSLSKEHHNDICVFFRGISAEENYFELMNYERLMAMRLRPEEGEEPGETYLIGNEKEIVIYVPEGKDPEEYFLRIREINPELKTAERLYKAYYSDAYIMKTR